MSNVHETHTHEDMLLDVREARLRQIREQARIVPGKISFPRRHASSRPRITVTTESRS